MSDRPAAGTGSSEPRWVALPLLLVFLLLLLSPLVYDAINCLAGGP